MVHVWKELRDCMSSVNRNVVLRKAHLVNGAHLKTIMAGKGGLSAGLFLENEIKNYRMPLTTGAQRSHCGSETITGTLYFISHAFI